MNYNNIGVGGRVGKLSILNMFTGNAGDRQYLIKCDCGVEKIVSFKSLRRGVLSCGCLQKERSSLFCKELNINRIKYSPYIASAHAIWRYYNKDGLTMDQFLELVKKPCHYCGSPPSNTRKSRGLHNVIIGDVVELVDFVYSGLDRKDSSIGHTYDNLVPCCKICNRIKSNMPVEDFMIWLRGIAKHTFNLEVVDENLHTMPDA